MDQRGEKYFKCFSNEATDVLNEYVLLSRDILKDKYGWLHSLWMFTWRYSHASSW